MLGHNLKGSRFVRFSAKHGLIQLFFVFGILFCHVEASATPTLPSGTLIYGQLWDGITVIDASTGNEIGSLGDLPAIAITFAIGGGWVLVESHPYIFAYHVGELRPVFRWRITSDTGLVGSTSHGAILSDDESLYVLPFNGRRTLLARGLGSVLSSAVDSKNNRVAVVTPRGVFVIGLDSMRHRIWRVGNSAQRLRFDDNRDLLLDAAPGDQTPSTRVHFFADGRPAGVEITRQFDVYRVGGRSVRIVNGCPLAPQLVFGHRNVFPTGPLRGEIRAIDTAPPNDITVATGPCDISHFERVEKGSVVIFGEDGSIIRSFQTWAFGKVSVAGLRQ